MISLFVSPYLMDCEQTKDRTGEIRTMMSRYPQYELVELRLEDAFDILWWRSLSKPLPATVTASVELGQYVRDRKYPPINSSYFRSLQVPTQAETHTTLPLWNFFKPFWGLFPRPRLCQHRYLTLSDCCYCMQQKHAHARICSSEVHRHHYQFL
jgi:hypothetical protein